MVDFGMPLKGQPVEFINRLAGGHMRERKAVKMTPCLGLMQSGKVSCFSLNWR